MEGSEASLTRPSRCLVALSLGIASCTLSSCRGDDREDEPGIRELVSLAAGQRLVEPRLSGGFGYSPCRDSTEPGRLLPKIVCSTWPKGFNRGVLNVVARIKSRKGSRKPSAQSLHARGVALLVGADDERVITASVEALKEAATRAPRDARILNDLASAYYVRGHRIDEPQDLERSLDCIARARKIDPSLPEAQFNLALILGRLHLQGQAVEEWRRYLSIDSDSEWAGEAKSSLAKLDTPSREELWSRSLEILQSSALQGNVKALRGIVAADSQASREYVSEDLLGRWGREILAGKPEEAAKTLRIAERIGEALQDVTGDPEVLECVRIATRAMVDPGDGEILGALARGHAAYAEGAAFFKRLAVEKAAPEFEQARRSFARANSSMELWALTGLGGVNLYQSHYSEAMETFGTVARSPNVSLFPALFGRVQWGMGLVFVRLAQFSESLSHFRIAASSLEKIGEMENSGQVENLIAENLRFLGQESEAWKHRYMAGSLLYNFRSSLRLHNLMWESGKAAVEENLPEAALFFQAEGIAVARSLGDSRFLAEALLRRGRILIALLRPQDALEDFRAAERSIGSGSNLTKDITAKRVLIDIAFAKGEVLQALNPSASVRYLSEALTAFQERKLTLDVAEAYLARARTLAFIGDEVAAEKDLRAAIDLFETRRLRIEDDNFRQSFSETAQRVFDEAILFELRRGKERNSLQLSERARIVPVVGAPAELAAEGRVSKALASLPKGVVFVEYAVTSQRLLIWTLHGGAFAFEQRSIEEGDLRRLEESFVAEVRDSARGGEASGLSARLYDLLLPSALSTVPEGIKICFIPDKELSGLPFAALRNPRSGRYLVEDHAISLSPSVLHAVEKPKDDGGIRREESTLSALLVGDPALNRQHFPGLPEIPSALVEINRIRPIYPDAKVIVGKDATREAILALLDRYEVFHYAGHAVTNLRHPAYSFLALAPSVSNTGSDALFAREIAEHRFTKLRLVVLSACNTIESADSRTASLTGLARPFLDAGAPAVLGTLWSVDDWIAREALSEFHWRFLKSRNAASALRETQLRLLRGPDSRLRLPSAWAVFQIVGSSN